MLQVLINDLQSPKTMLHFSLKSWQFMSIVWLSFIMLAALNCFLYGLLLSKESHSFQQSFAWAVEYWWAWAILSPMALISSRQLITEPFQMALLRSHLFNASLFTIFAILLSSFIPFIFNGLNLNLLWQSINKQVFDEFYIGFVVYAVIVFFGYILLLSKKNERKTQIKQLKSNNYMHRLVASKGNHKAIIEVNDICYICASGNYLEVYTNKEVFLIRKTMKAMQEQLDPALFVRIHRSTIVAIKYVDVLAPRSCGDYLMTLKCGTQLIVSKSYRNILKIIEENEVFN